MIIKISSNYDEHMYDYIQIVQNIFPHSIINDIETNTFDIIINHTCNITDTIKNMVEITDNLSKKIFKFSKEFKIDFDLNDTLLFKRYIKKFAKLTIYESLSKFYHIKLDWGALTGVRPTKMAWDIYCNKIEKTTNIKKIDENILNSVKKEMIKTYFVKPSKMNLISEIMHEQIPYEMDERLVNLYINIPFCTTRCSYCSFISCQIDKKRSFVAEYIEKLKLDIQDALALINRKNYKVKSIYVGGGTPTSFTASELQEILKEIKINCCEWTVEAGRPDTITKEKLEMLKNLGVSRISINPQTFNDKILKQIGRSHTHEDIIKTFNMAKEFDFIINMDTIAGLPNESVASFKNTIDNCINLQPDNITVHTLALKTKSNLAKEENYKSNDKNVKTMINYASKKLKEANYMPYYMYRQKYMLGNLENVGYAKNGTTCQFNIDSMEDTCSIIACGANAISKKIFFSENRIERHANAKDIKTYIENLDKYLKERNELFDAE